MEVFIFLRNIPTKRCGTVPSENIFYYICLKKTSLSTYLSIKIWHHIFNILNAMLDSSERAWEKCYRLKE
jgi:hypothetical protein